MTADTHVLLSNINLTDILEYLVEYSANVAYEVINDGDHDPDTYSVQMLKFAMVDFFDDALLDMLDVSGTTDKTGFAGIVNMLLPRVLERHPEMRAARLTQCATSPAVQGGEG